MPKVPQPVTSEPRSVAHKPFALSAAPNLAASTSWASHLFPSQTHPQPSALTPAPSLMQPEVLTKLTLKGGRKWSGIWGWQSRGWRRFRPVYCPGPLVSTVPNPHPNTGAPVRLRHAFPAPTKTPFPISRTGHLPSRTKFPNRAPRTCSARKTGG